MKSRPLHDWDIGLETDVCKNCKLERKNVAVNTGLMIQARGYRVFLVDNAWVRLSRADATCCPHGTEKIATSS